VCSPAGGGTCASPSSLLSAEGPRKPNEWPVYGGDPGAYKKRIATIEGASPTQIQAAANSSLGIGGQSAVQNGPNGRFILHVLPFPKYSTLTQGADRSQVPDAGTPAEATFPKFEAVRSGMSAISPGR